MSAITKTVKIQKKTTKNPLSISSSKEDFLDIYKDGLDTFRKDGENIYDRPKEGFMRLTKPSFKSRQVLWLSNLIDAYDADDYRVLTRLHEDLEFEQINQIRQSWIDIQREVGIRTISVLVHKNENISTVKSVLEEFEGDCRLVLDMRMYPDDLKEVLEWAVPRCAEVVLLSSDIQDHSDSYSVAVTVSSLNPGKIHMYGCEWNLFGYGKDPVLATFLISQGFKSVSFKRSTPPPYIFAHKSVRERPQKTAADKFEQARWVDPTTLLSVDSHPSGCNCLGKDIDMNAACLDHGVESCVYLHNIHVLDRIYSKLQSDEQFRSSILELESIKEISGKLAIS